MVNSAVFEQMGFKAGGFFPGVARQAGVFLVFIFSLFLAVAAPPVNATQWECGERSNLPQEGKNYCAAGDFRLADSKLKRDFLALTGKYEQHYGNSDALTSAQDAFESYRDNQCIAENQRLADKAYHSMVVAQCKTRLTNIRIDELSRLANTAF